MNIIRERIVILKIIKQIIKQLINLLSINKKRLLLIHSWFFTRGLRSLITRKIAIMMIVMTIMMPTVLVSPLARTIVGKLLVVFFASHLGNNNFIVRFICKQRFFALSNCYSISKKIHK